MAQFIVTEYKVQFKPNADICRSFIGVFSQEALPYFIQIKIAEYADAGGYTKIEPQFMKRLVAEVIEVRSMTWIDDDTEEDNSYIVIDNINPKEFEYQPSLIYHGNMFILKDCLDKMREEVKKIPHPCVKKKAQAVPVEEESSSE